MKKIFSILAAAVIALTFASCNNQGGQGGTSFKITVDEVTYNSAHVAVQPADTSVTYYWEVFEAAEIASLTDDSIASLLTDYVEYLVEYYKYFGYDVQISDFLVKGADDYSFTSLSAQTDYLVLAIQMDATGKTTGTVAKKAFTTPELKPEKTENITLSDAIIEDNTLTYGWWQLMAANADSSIYISISPLEATQVDGTWTEDDMDDDYTFIILNRTEGYNFAKCNFTITSANGAFTLTGTALAENAVQYNLNITGNVLVPNDEEVAPAKAKKRILATEKKLSSKALQFFNK